MFTRLFVAQQRIFIECDQTDRTKRRLMLSDSTPFLDCHNSPKAPITFLKSLFELRNTS